MRLRRASLGRSQPSGKITKCSLNGQQISLQVLVTFVAVYVISQLKFPASFQFELGGTETNFVYVYELPDKYNHDLIKDESDWSREPLGRGAEFLLHRLFLNSNVGRTFDPEKADLFLVPVYLARFLEIQRKENPGKALENTGKFLEDALGYVQETYPYWKKSNGRDHFLVASHDYGRCTSLLLADSETVGEMFSVQLYGRTTLELLHPTLKERLMEVHQLSETSKALACLVPTRDVVVPSPGSTNQVFSPLGRPRERDLIQGHDFAVAVHFDEHGLPLFSDALAEPQISEAKLCMSSDSHPWATPFLCLAAMAGCIPVLLKGNASLALPWQDSLPYSQFSLVLDLSLDADSARQLAEKVLDVAHNPVKLAMMQKVLGNVQRHFRYSSANGEPALAFADLLKALRSRSAALEKEGRFLEASPLLQAVRKPRLGGRIQPITAQGSKVRLCTPPSAPFVSGTFHLGEDMAQLIVFEAELLSGLKHGTSTKDKYAPPMVQILSFLEDQASINESAFHGWGGAMISSKYKTLNLTCEFWPGHGRQYTRGLSPLFSSDAIIAQYTMEFTVQIHCPLPHAHSMPDQLSRVDQFQIVLSAKDSLSSTLHMPSLPLCREDCQKRNQNGIPRALPEASQKVGIPPQNLAICLYPFRDHRPFDLKRRANAWENLLEWVDFHLLIGISRVYFYDRYWDEKLPLLQKYIDRGVVVHVPFPMWSEVFYRKEMYNKTNSPYLFPMIYDQILSYEHCMMQGRRHDMDWIFFIDFDEFLSFPESSPGGLAKVMQKLEKSHKGKLPLAVARIQRYNFLGGVDNRHTGSILDTITKRCQNPMKHKWYSWEYGKDIVDSHDKLATKPHLMVGSKAEIHFTKQTPKEAISILDTSDLNIHHYASTSKEEYRNSKMNFSPCKEVDFNKEDSNLVEDMSLVWTTDHMNKCAKRCHLIGSDFSQCGTFCGKWTSTCNISLTETTV